MTKKIPFSESHLSIAFIWEWYEITKESIKEYKNRIKNLVHNSAAMIPAKFCGKSLNEIDQYFTYHLDELENTVCLNLLTATEAILRIEYLKRVYEKDREPLSRDFRELYKIKENRANFEKDILSLWSKNYSNDRDVKQVIGQLKGALKYRHWLAHGRYWKSKKMGRQTYDAYSIYIIANNIILYLDFKFL